MRTKRLKFQFTKLRTVILKSSQRAFWGHVSTEYTFWLIHFSVWSWSYLILTTGWVIIWMIQLNLIWIGDEKRIVTFGREIRMLSVKATAFAYCKFNFIQSIAACITNNTYIRTVHVVFTSFYLTQMSWFAFCSFFFLPIKLEACMMNKPNIYVNQLIFKALWMHKINQLNVRECVHLCMYMRFWWVCLLSQFHSYNLNVVDKWLFGRHESSTDPSHFVTIYQLRRTNHYFSNCVPLKIFIKNPF